MCSDNDRVNRVIFFKDVLEEDREFVFVGKRASLIKLLYALARSRDITPNSIGVISIDPDPPDGADDGAGKQAVAPANAT